MMIIVLWLPWGYYAGMYDEFGKFAPVSLMSRSVCVTHTDPRSLLFLPVYLSRHQTGTRASIDVPHSVCTTHRDYLRSCL